MNNKIICGVAKDSPTTDMLSYMFGLFIVL